MGGNENTALYTEHRVALALLSLLLLAAILEIVRRGYLKERYALLWLATALVGLVVGLFPRIIVLLANLLNFQYLTVITLAALLFILGLVLSFSIVISRLAERNRQLVQEVALLSARLETLEKRHDE
jgi:hypothetical protein